jgi:hypothetical protein
MTISTVVRTSYMCDFNFAYSQSTSASICRSRVVFIRVDNIWLLEVGTAMAAVVQVTNAESAVRVSFTPIHLPIHEAHFFLSVVHYTASLRLLHTGQ